MEAHINTSPNQPYTFLKSNTKHPSDIVKSIPIPPTPEKKLKKGYSYVLEYVPGPSIDRNLIGPKSVSESGRQRRRIKSLDNEIRSPEYTKQHKNENPNTSQAK